MAAKTWTIAILATALAGLPIPADASESPRIMIYGDSLASSSCEFWGAMQKEFPNAAVIPNGVVGAPTWQIAAPFTPDKLDPPPDLIIVLMGVNNVTHDPNHRPESGWKDLDTMRQRARDAKLPLLIGTPLPYGRWTITRDPCPPWWSNQYVVELRRLILQRSRPDVIDFDQAIPFAAPDKWLPDCLHPNAAGAERMAKLVRKTICGRKLRSRYMRLCE